MWLEAMLGTEQTRQCKQIFIQEVCVSGMRKHYKPVILAYCTTSTIPGFESTPHTTTPPVSHQQHSLARRLRPCQLELSSQTRQKPGEQPGKSICRMSQLLDHRPHDTRLKWEGNKISCGITTDVLPANDVSARRITGTFSPAQIYAAIWEGKPSALLGWGSPSCTHRLTALKFATALSANDWWV